MIINRMGGGATGELQIGEIVATDRTITDPSFKACDGTIIGTPTGPLISGAFSHKEFATGNLSATGAVTGTRPHAYYDGTYFLYFYIAPSTSYPTVHCWTRNSNGLFVSNGAKTVASVACKYNYMIDCNDTNSGGAIIKCGNYFYVVFVDASNNVYVGYTTNPTSSWSYKQIDLSGHAFNRAEYPVLMTNGSAVVLDIPDYRGSRPYYQFATYKFTGDLTDIALIREQTGGNSWASTAEHTYGVIKIGNYWCSSLFGNVWYYKTFEGAWTEYDTGEGSLNRDWVGFDGTRYWYMDYDSDITKIKVGYGTSFPSFYTSPTSSFTIDATTWPSPNSTYHPRGGSGVSNGSGVFFYNNAFYKMIYNSSQNVSAIFQLSTSGVTKFHEWSGTPTGGIGIPSPTRAFEIAIMGESNKPFIFGPAVPDYTSLNRNTYMKLT